MTLPRFLLFPLLVGQNGLHHVAGLGDMGEVDLGCDALRGARHRSAPTAGTRALEMLAHLLGFIAFQGAGMRFAGIQAELHQYVENPSTLDFHLAREIVDTNLTHPPLFKLCFPQPVSRS
jgi:hypothetical protein